MAEGHYNPHAEWLEADGLGGFASGRVDGVRTRRYHALLLTARRPPTDRVLLVSGFDAFVDTPAGNYALSAQRYGSEATSPDGYRRIESFRPDPWPRWTFHLEDGTRIVQEILVRRGHPATACAWRLEGGATEARLSIRPFVAGRDYHALHHENGELRFDAEVLDPRVTWHPYADLPRIVCLGNGRYAHEPHWYRSFFYAEERERGLDDTEDLAAPGVFTFDLTQGEAVLVFSADGRGLEADAAATLASMREEESRHRSRFRTRAERAADSYIVARGTGKTIVAGYPWFADWGRDTFIALRGLCLATGRHEDARDILVEWAGAVSDGLLPNRFPDTGDVAEFNSVDASLWYVIAVYECLQAAPAVVSARDRQTLLAAVEAILTGYAQGTRHGIRADADGLLAAGEPGVQLTWMDAKVGDWVVTPRIGKPVEIQALWLNALRIGSGWSSRWRDLYQVGVSNFRARFWNENGFLHDVVDVDHRSGRVDSSFRPNQILAVGGLPFQVLDGEAARQVVDAVEARLLTPLGLRSLAWGEPGYVGRYEGGVRERDGAYHQGTVWPWLLGPFVEAWVRVRGGTSQAKAEARAQFVQPLLFHLDEAGLGHISEIADGDAPHAPRGCPFQAWSVGEALRLDRVVLA